MSDYKFGVLKYSAINIGDDIQSIAAMRFLPRIDEYIHRDRMDKYRSSIKTKVIMNAAWMLEPWHMPPSDDVEPLLTSVHLKCITRKHMSKKLVEYLIAHGPVGARDTNTMEYLLNLGVPSYFSGCLTTTLVKNPNIKKGEHIIAVDMPKYIVDEISKRTCRKVYSISRLALPYFNQIERFKLAKLQLYMYHSAHCVVTKALHAAIPCLVFDTPVLMLDLKAQPFDNKNDPRYYGLLDLFDVINEKDFVLNRDIYDFDNPPQNPKRYLQMRDNLINTCSNFTGFDNANPSISEFAEPMLEMYSMMGYQQYRIDRMAYWSNPSVLFSVALKKILLKKTRCDLKI